ncbi:MAG: hypothetical protein QW680_09150 [Pyrobaculum sp.]
MGGGRGGGKGASAAWRGAFGGGGGSKFLTSARPRRAWPWEIMSVVRLWGWGRSVGGFSFGVLSLGGGAGSAGVVVYAVTGVGLGAP